MKIIHILPAVVLAVGTVPAFADNNTGGAAPNLSATFGQFGPADTKLDNMNEAFGSDYGTVGSMMSDHVKSYEDVGPGRSGLAPLSDNANNAATSK